MVWVAMVLLKKVRPGLTLLEGDQGRVNVAGERQIECGVGFTMAVSDFLPGAGISLMVVAVFHRPVFANRLCRAPFCALGEAGEKEAGVAFLCLERVFPLRPVALDRDGRAGSRQPGVSAQALRFGLVAQIAMLFHQRIPTFSEVVVVCNFCFTLPVGFL